MLFSKLLLLMIIFFVVNLEAKSLSVIVSKDSSLFTLSINTLSKLFLSKTKSLPNGKQAITLELDNKEYRALFYTKVSLKNERQLRKYWTTMIFTGRGTPPKQMKTINEIIEYVKKNTNAIAYIPSSNIIDNEVTVLLEIQ